MMVSTHLAGLTCRADTNESHYQKFGPTDTAGGYLCELDLESGTGCFGDQDMNL